VEITSTGGLVTIGRPVNANTSIAISLAGAYSGAGTLTSGGAISITGGTGIAPTGNVRAAGNITMSGSGQIYFYGISVSSSAGSISATAGSVANNAVLIRGSSVTTDSQRISLTGTSTSGDGVYIYESSTISSVSGEIVISGTTSNRQGVYVIGSSKISTSSGDITITGTGTDWGVFLEAIEITSSSGDIAIDSGNRGFVAGHNSTTTTIGATASGTASGDITVLGNRYWSGSTKVNYKTTGAVVLNSKASNYIEAPTYNNHTFTGASSVTIGSLSAAYQVTVDADGTIAGPFTVMGQYVNFDAGTDITTNLGAASSGPRNIGILAKATDRIHVSAGADLTSSGSDIVLWSDSDNSGVGSIHFAGSNILKSNGGRISIAGGLDDGGAVNTEFVNRSAGDGHPDNYAAGISGWGDATGVEFLGGYQILSGGGDVFIAGRGSAVSGDNDWGVLMTGGLVYSGSGKIAIYGRAPASCAASSHRGIATGWGAQTSLVSESQATDAVSLYGNTASCNSGGSVYASAVESHNDWTNIATPNGGGIKVYGIQGNASYDPENWLDSSTVQLSYVNFVSNSGPIFIHAENATTSSTYNIKFANNASSRRSFGAVPSGWATGHSGYPTIAAVPSTSNVTLKANTMQPYYADFRTSGHLSFEPNTTFDSTQAINLSSDWGVTFPLKVASFTVGAPASAGVAQSSSNIDLTAISSSGPITVYGGAITYEGALASDQVVLLSGTKDITLGFAISAGDSALVQTSGGDVLANAGISAGAEGITLKASKDILVNTSAKTISTSGSGDIVFWANSGGAGGEVDTGGTSVSINSNGGDIVIGGGADDGANGGTSADGIPDNFLLGRTWNHTARLNASMTSGNGDILVRSQAASGSTATAMSALQVNAGVQITASSGTIRIDARQNSGNTSAGNQYAIWLGTGGAKAVIRSATGNVILNGDASLSNRAQRRGILLYGVDITATTGNVELNGASPGQTASFDVLGWDTSTVTAGGNILLSGARTSGTEFITFNAGGTTTLTVGQLIGGDAGDHTSGATSVATAFAGSGSVVIQPFSTDFTAAQTLANVTIASSITGLTVGK
jgi:hypothetical protein